MCKLSVKELTELFLWLVNINAFMFNDTRASQLSLHM